MKNRIIFSMLFVLSVTFNTSAKQDKYVKHTVAQGETITMIAQKYKVTPYDIYKLNPDSQNGIELNSVLLIPPTVATSTFSAEEKQTTPKAKGNSTTHLVQPKETLFSLSRQYGVSVDAIKSANAELLKDGLKIGQTIRIPSAVAHQETYEKPVTAPKETPKPVVKSESKPEVTKANVTYHTIEPKETKYGISKKYGMTIQELERLNPAIVNDFPVGLKLVISGNPESKTGAESSRTKEETPKAPTVSTKKYLEEYVVRPKETISSIANDYGMTEQELIALNPELKKGVKLGMILRVPKGQRKEPIKKEQGNLMKKINTNARKQLALLLPFNISKIESDTVNSTQARLKKDKFLNMTLDFYSGALMAIDSARVLGMNVDIKILDSQETKNTFDAASLVTENNLSAMDAVIGPFYQANVEKLAEMLQSTNTPVISPLSKESGKKFSNLYQSMPSLEQMRASIFEFMNAKAGNVVAVVDPKKGSVKQYLQENQASARIVGLSAKNTFSADSLRVCLKKDKMNYVVLASESTGMILATTNAMLAAQKDYQVQLVIMEPNETLDFEEISLTRLTKLKLLYPSLTRPNESVEANQFDVKYKKLNKIIPNAFAIRGFDVTFDTLLRLSQEKTFEQTIQFDDSEQIESKFNYNPNSTHGYSNSGIYILYYDTDLSIKEAS
ncbi:LysM peptidoglycan-binding domain-containing protein [Flavobacterium sp.]|uniref:PBP1 and LysM peptidoglycan-binding domain-containing protein n=1 Tax=Flavobacterium sp. TaxID=239 RepID=UPI0025D047EF|nr:LysM peptidoglycan-binding domain-containing protein [Flavobacterium sp.]